MSKLNSQSSPAHPLPVIRNPQVQSDELWLAIRDLRDLLQMPGSNPVRR